MTADDINKERFECIKKAMFDFIEDSPTRLQCVPLSDDGWRVFSTSSNAQKVANEVHEAAGDAYLNGLTADVIFETFPDENTSMYSSIHGVAKSNVLFSKTAEYFDLSPFAPDVRRTLKGLTFGLGQDAPYKSKNQAKPTGDAFETATSMYVEEAGMDKFEAWGKALFSGPIRAGGAAYKSFDTNRSDQPPPSPSKMRPAGATKTQPKHQAKGKRTRTTRNSDPKGSLHKGRAPGQGGALQAPQRPFSIRSPAPRARCRQRAGGS
ncbi:hypothetical protein PsYK624_149710 [Phanerochaete sordida]|uniref:RNase III domain-containing protein n=1 Tax=Phanerochaete sordida TaxID=48140 RepID=A0A9P3GPE9_9APHY|nr:hypothetical protein PsYK624_149710 [Phanerochaete sordida]